GYTSKKNRLVKLAPSSVEYRLRCLECLQRTLVECLFHPKTAWKDLGESLRKAAPEKLDASMAAKVTFGSNGETQLAA
ncbi:MAG: hypothetical protein ACREFE_20475, partial [Limisphaerales bacterium]